MLAPLALQAEVERLAHALLAPALIEGIAAHHLEQEVRAAAGRMHFLARRLEARAHRLPAEAAAFADPKAALGGLSKAAVVVRVLEVGLDVPRRVIRAEAQIGVEWVGVDDLARVHPPMRVPDGFEFTKSLDQLGAEHLR